MNNVLIAFALLLLSVSSPPRVTDPPPNIAVVPAVAPADTLGPGLRVTFPRGVTDICVWFVSSIETIERDGEVIPYAPTHCWLVDDDDLGEIEDNWSFIEPNGGEWDVYARLYYTMPDDTVQELETNHIKVTR